MNLNFDSPKFVGHRWAYFYIRADTKICRRLDARNFADMTFDEVAKKILAQNVRKKSAQEK